MLFLILLMVSSVQSYPSLHHRCSTLTGTDYELCMSYDTIDLELRYFTDEKAICNDGTTAGYYVRQNSNSRVWIVYLAGGWFCYDEKSCDVRMNQSHTKSMTTSKILSAERRGLGLLEQNFHKNPLFWNANHVYVPYCSSDFWLGNTSRTLSSGKQVHFHGSHIVTSVIKELLTFGLRSASRLVLAGSSAGGIGVLQNIDRISKLLVENDVNIDVRGIVDSAWFLDNGENEDCQSTNIYDCHPTLQFKQAIRYWKAFFHPECTKRFGKDDAHKCLFAHEVIKNIKTPLFIFQWLYDTVQIMADNKDLESNTQDILQPKYINYVNKLGNDMRNSLKKAIHGPHGVFAVSCISHTALTTTAMWNSIELRRSTLNDALNCWLSTHKKNHHTKKTRKCKHKLIDTCKYLTCNKQCPAIYNPRNGKEIYIPSYSQMDNKKKIEGVSPFETPYPNDILKKDIDLINSMLNSWVQGTDGKKIEKSGS